MSEPALNHAGRKARATIAAIERHNGPDDPRLPQLRADLAAARLEEHIRSVVDRAPPPTPAQLERLASLLMPAPRTEQTP